MECTNCKIRFEYQSIDDTGIINYFLPRKPDMAQEGVEVLCPKCDNKARYFYVDLRYRG